MHAQIRCLATAGLLNASPVGQATDVLYSRAAIIISVMAPIPNVAIASQTPNVPRNHII